MRRRSYSRIRRRHLGARGRTIFQRAVKEFGTTDNPLEAGYILPDGSMLDFSEKREGGPPGRRSADHRAVARVFRKAVGGSDAMLEFMRQGAIRMQSYDGELYLDIAEGMKPSHEQLATIRRIAKWHDSATVEYTQPDTGVVEVYRRWGTPDESSVHISWYDPSSILQWIRHRSLGYEGLGSSNGPFRGLGRLGLVPDTQLWESARISYPPTDNPSCAGYILPDGTWLDMCMGGRYPVHDIIRWAYPDEDRRELGH
jgi:hypothetical protein